MDVHRGKLAEYVMYSEGFDRYEEFAVDSENFATIDSSQDTTTNQGSFELYVDGSTSKRALVKSNHIYGSSRRIERLVFDIAHYSSAWIEEETAAFQAIAPGGNGNTAVDFDGVLSIGVRPVLTDFATDTITWKKAITDAELNFGGIAWAEAGNHGGNGSVIVATLGTNGGSIDIGDWASAYIYLKQEFPGLLVFKWWDAGDNWNSESDIYGWELRLAYSGTTTTSAEWTGSVGGGTHSVAFAILN